MKTRNGWLCGVVALVSVACGAEGSEPESIELNFANEAPVMRDVVVETDYVELMSGVEVRTVTTVELDASFAASGIAKGSRIEGIDGTGELGFVGRMTIEMYARVDDPPFEGLVGTETFTTNVPVGEFDPFLIEDPRVLGLDVSSQIRMEVQSAVVPGLTFGVEASLAMLPTYEGVCLQIDEDEGIAQYTMRLQPLGDLVYLYTLDVPSPLGSTRVAEVGVGDNPLFGVDGDLSEFGRVYDAGQIDLSDGSALEGDDEGPCGPVDPPV